MTGETQLSKGVGVLEGGAATSLEIAAYSGLTIKTVCAYLYTLHSEGMVRRVGRQTIPGVKVKCWIYELVR